MYILHSIGYFLGHFLFLHFLVDPTLLECKISFLIVVFIIVNFNNNNNEAFCYPMSMYNHPIKGLFVALNDTLYGSIKSALKS